MYFIYFNILYLYNYGVFVYLCVRLLPTRVSGELIGRIDKSHYSIAYDYGIMYNSPNSVCEVRGESSGFLAEEMCKCL